MHAAPFEHAAQGENVARVVVDEQNRLTDEVLIRAVQPFEHTLHVIGQVPNYPM